MNVLIADDSAVIRIIIEQNLSKEEDINIIASVSNGRKAVQSARDEKPDVAVIDVHMPDMNGVETTRILAKELSIPVLAFSDNENDKASVMEAGAVSFILKPNLTSSDGTFFESFAKQLRTAASKPVFNHGSQRNNVSKVVTQKKSPLFSRVCEKGKSTCYNVLCIGASTGGPSATQQVLLDLGENFPLPVLYVQHIEIGADKNMVGWFNSTCPNVEVCLAKDGEEALPGHVYMAPADKHMKIDYVKKNGNPVIILTDEPQLYFLRPAVDKLFYSAAECYGKKCLAVLLTGMGYDGADGCKKIKDAGGCTIVEDKSTCAVFGMPCAAIEAGAAIHVEPRYKIADKVLRLIYGEEKE